jgi:2'-5' RNA ligase
VNSPASVGGRDRPRLFVALVLPEDTVRRLGAWQREAFDGVRDVRIVPPGNLHVTLAFLGPRPAEEVERVASSLREAAAGAPRPVFSVVRYRETRSVGMLVLSDEDGRAAAFADDLHGGLARAGLYEPESRPWLPHLTVLRFRSPPRLEPDPPELGAISPSEAAVYHSVLRRSGAQYEIVESVALGGTSGP